MAGAAHKRYLRAGGGKGFGQRVAHLARRAVAEEANGVERLVGGAGGEENVHNASLNEQ